MKQTKTDAVRIYVMEEQEIYREVYRTVLPTRPSVELLEVASNHDVDSLKKSVAGLNPDVLLLSTKRLETDAVEVLEQIRTTSPRVGIILLLMHYSAQDIEMLRRLALKGEGGMALFLKQSLDQVEQLFRTIMAVRQGQVILDPQLAAFMFAGKPECPFLKQLTSREMEILSLLAQGYTNAAIAQTLFIDIKTVEHHLNSMYSKLKADTEYNDKHLRVSAARLYLETMGKSYHREGDLALAGSRR
ncbi:MAG: response regulator transcription factor [Dehalococcoidales bacterium]|nr:response regulator transcription factor [Dehalococcoidales bacterium]